MVTITSKDYFGKWDDVATHEHTVRALDLLTHVNNLLDAFTSETGNEVPVNPATGSQVSGQQYGGFRPKYCPIGAVNSAHKTGEAVDVYDPDNSLDIWLDDEVLEQFKLYREAPTDTDGWCHLTTRAPASKRRTFLP